MGFLVILIWRSTEPRYYCDPDHSDVLVSDSNKETISGQIGSWFAALRRDRLSETSLCYGGPLLKSHPAFNPAYLPLTPLPKSLPSSFVSCFSLQLASFPSLQTSKGLLVPW